MLSNQLFHCSDQVTSFVVGIGININPKVVGKNWRGIRYWRICLYTHHCHCRLRLLNSTYDTRGFQWESLSYYGNFYIDNYKTALWPTFDQILKVNIIITIMYWVSIYLTCLSRTLDALLPFYHLLLKLIYCDVHMYSNSYVFLSFYLWLFWVFLAAPGVSLVVASGGYSV